MKRFSAVFLLLVLPVVSAPAAEPLARRLKSTDVSAARVEFDSALFDRITKGNKALEVELPLPGGVSVVALVQPRVGTVFSPEAEIVVQDDAGAHARSLPHVVSVVGEVLGETDSSLQIGRAGGTYFGFLTRSQGGTLSIGPASAGGGGAHQISAVHGSAPADAGAWCRQEEVPGQKAAAEPVAPVKATASLKTIDVAVDSDYELYKKMGFDEDRALAYIAAVFESVSAIYERDLGATLRVVAVRQWVTPRDPYSGGSSDILTFSRNQVQANRYPAAFANADAIHVLGCGRIRGGIAYRDTLNQCVINGREYRVGFSDLDGVYSYPASSYTWDVAVVAHELGHNVGSPHTHCFSPPIDRCYTTEAGCVTGTAVGQEGTIMSYCHLATGGSVRLAFSQREIDLMRNYLATAAACLPGPVTLAPDPPVAGQPLTITYDPAGRNLAGASTVWLMRTENDFASGSYFTLPMTREGALWTSSYTVPSTAFSTVIGFHNGSGTYDNLSNRYWRSAAVTTTPSTLPIPTDRVVITPDPPVRGSNATIVYTATGTSLAGAATVELHRGLDGWAQVLPRLRMTSTGSGVWTATWPVPSEARSIEFVFTNGAAAWDNNNQDDWHFRTAAGLPDEWMIR